MHRILRIRVGRARRIIVIPVLGVGGRGAVDSMVSFRVLRMATRALTVDATAGATPVQGDVEAETKAAVVAAAAVVATLSMLTCSLPMMDVRKVKVRHG